MRSLSASAATPRPLARSAWSSLLAAGIALGLAAFIAAPAVAVPAGSLASKQAQAAALDRDVAKLEDSYGDLQERWRGAIVELRRVQQEMADAQAKLEVAKIDLRGAKSRLRQRAIAIYRDGAGSSEMLQITEAGSLKEFFDRLDTIERVSNQDTSVLAKVRSAARRVAQQEARLRTARASQAKVVKRAASSKKKMKTVLSKKQAALSSVTAEIRTIMAQQRAAAERADAIASRSRGQLVAEGQKLEGAIDLQKVPEASTGEPGSSPSSSSSPSPAVSVPLPPVSGSAAAAAGIAMSKIGTPYSYGAAGPNSFDCSGLVIWAFAQAGRSGLPHSTYSLIGMGVEVPMSQAQVGDLVFTDNSGHMGIYVGGGSFVHSPRTGRTVTVEGLGYYNVVSIRRI